MKFDTDIFSQFDKKWALLSAGTKDDHNTMTVRDLGEAITYEEAEITFLCRRIYRADMLTSHMPVEVVNDFYTPEEPHTLYIGEVIEIIQE